MLFELLVHVNVLIESREPSRDAAEQSTRSVEGTFLRPVVAASQLAVTFAFCSQVIDVQSSLSEDFKDGNPLSPRSKEVRSLDATSRSAIKQHLP